MGTADELDGETVTDALDVLDDVGGWQLAAPRWERVHAILDAMARAVADGDSLRLREAVADLELSGPVRAVRIGSTPKDGIPDPVRDRRNSLVHALVKDRPRPPATPGR